MPDESPQNYVDRWINTIKSVGRPNSGSFSMNLMKFTKTAILVISEPYLNLNLTEKKLLQESWSTFETTCDGKLIDYETAEGVKQRKVTFGEFLRAARAKDEYVFDISPPKPILTHISPLKLLNPAKLAFTIINITKLSVFALVDRLIPPKNIFASSMPATILKTVIGTPLNIVAAILKPIADLDYVLFPEPVGNRIYPANEQTQSTHQQSPTLPREETPVVDSKSGRGISFIHKGLNPKQDLHDVLIKAKNPPITAANSSTERKPLLALTDSQPTSKADIRPTQDLTLNRANTPRPGK